MGFMFSVEIHKAHIYCKYIKTNSGRINIYFFRGKKKCRKDHEVEKSVFLRAAFLCKIKLQVYTPIPFHSSNIWYLLFCFFITILCVNLYASLKKFNNRTLKMVTIIVMCLHYIYIALIVYLALKMFICHGRKYLNKNK